MYTRNRTFLTLAVVAMASLFVAGASADAAIIVAESFGGDGTGQLTGTSADTFAITAAGASATWQAVGNNRNTDGTSLAADSTAFLALGSHINAVKGTASGLFTLSATLTEPSKWITVGFFYGTPTLANNLTSNNMAATMLVNSNQIQHFGPDKASAGGHTGGSGTTLCTIVLDLTPGGGYNGSDNFGTATYYDGTTATPSTGSYTFTSAIDFVAIGMTDWVGTGTVADLTLTQVPEPATMSLIAIGGLGVLLKRRRRRA